jgi:hypothetical protein
MNRRWLAILVVGAVLVAMTATLAQAQEGTCIARGIYYQACYLAEDDLEVLRIEGGKGVSMGIIPGEVYPYAAANLTAPQLLFSLSDAAGYSLELYFTGKQLAPVNGYDTTWTIVFYGPAGPLTRTEYVKRAAADPSVVLPFAPAARPSVRAADAPAPAAAPVVGTYEPSIVQGGSVANCLVRANHTVRMRTAPSTGAAVLDRVPFETAMPADMITADGGWVRAFFVGEGGVGHLGWVAASYLDLSEACAGLTTAQPLSGGVAAAVPAPAVQVPAAAAAQPTAEATSFDPTFGGQLDLTIVQGGSVGTCLVRTTFTVRMRAMPSDSAPVMESVPFQSSMPADLTTSDGAWVRANYLGSLGWINSRYLSLSEACAGLGAINPLN